MFNLADVLYPHTNGRNWQMLNGERSALIFLLEVIKPRYSIEIGIGQGGGTNIIAHYSQHVYSLDIIPQAAEYVKNLENVEPHIGDSQETLPAILSAIEKEQHPLDFVLIDGDHSETGVRRDCQFFIRSLKPRNPVYVLMHDSFNPNIREGIWTAGWETNPHVALLDLDFMPGQMSPHVNRYFREMWGGFALAVFSPDQRQGYLEVHAELDLESYFLLPFTAYAQHPNYATLLSNYKNRLVNLIPDIETLRDQGLKTIKD